MRSLLQFVKFRCMFSSRICKQIGQFQISNMDYIDKKLTARRISYHGNHPIEVACIFHLSSRGYVTELQTTDYKTRRKNAGEKLQELAIFSKNMDCKGLTHAEWKKLEDDILLEDPSMKISIDYAMLKACSNNIELALSFMEYVKSVRSPSLASRYFYIDVCGEKYPQLALEEFHDLEKSIDPSLLTHKYIITGLAHTSEWKRSLMLIEQQISLHNILPDNNVALLAILKAALKAQDYEVFFSLIQKYKHVLDRNAIGEMIFNQWQNGKIVMDIALELLKIDDVVLLEEHVNEMFDFFKREWSHNVKAEFTRANRSRICGVCKKELDENFLTESEFSELSDQFFQKAFDEKNVYKNTTPVELQGFLKFLQANKPFDVVIDGLNVFNNKFKIWNGMESMFKKRPVLIISKHGHHFRNGNNTKCFVVHPRSHDDYFALTAAFKSGRNSFVLSNDAFRDHKALLDKPIQYQFFKWQRYRQITWENTDILHPNQCGMITQETEDGWHIPYMPNNFTPACASALHQMNMFRPDTFLCVQKADYVPAKEILDLKRRIQVLASANQHNCPNIK